MPPKIFTIRICFVTILVKVIKQDIPQNKTKYPAAQEVKVPLPSEQCSNTVWWDTGASQPPDVKQYLEEREMAVRDRVSRDGDFLNRIETGSLMQPAERRGFSQISKPFQVAFLTNKESVRTHSFFPRHSQLEQFNQLLTNVKWTRPYFFMSYEKLAVKANPLNPI